MIRIYLFLILLFNTLPACNIDINATIYPEKHQLVATVQKEHQLIKYIDKSLPKQITKHFVMLLDDWYPRSVGLCQYRLHLTLPKNFIAMSEGDVIMIEEKNATKTTHFSLAHPINRINIIASDDFSIHSAYYTDINISTYFFHRHSALSQKYLLTSIDYIKRYEKMLGAFAFKRFSIIENQFQTGYSMPTFTLIGDKIIHRPFLLQTSLGHEILHQWFGNSLFNDFKKGNWVEGLTTYLSDHYYHDNPMLYRKNILNDYAIYVDTNNTSPLASFSHRYDKTSASIGYGKGAFAFHMLRKELGDARFFKILRQFYQSYRFKEASYHDIEVFFEDKSGKELTALFDYIFEQTTPLDLQVRDVATIYHDKDDYQLDFTLLSGVKNFSFPLLIMIDDKPYHLRVKDNTSVSITLDHRPTKLTLDPHYDLFRRLGKEEKLLSLAMAFHKNKNFLDNAKILPSQQKGFSIEILPNASLKIQSSDLNQSKDMRYRLPHYGKYQRLHFVDGKLIQKEKSHSQDGLVYKLFSPDENLSLALDSLSQQRIIFIGEQHDNFAHHINQLKIIQARYHDNPNIAIGMEMFQRRFQPVLDAYIAGDISEKTFLKQSEYFTRWGYEYRLYKPIIDFAKKHSIPLVALNLEKEITKQISKHGLKSLSKEDNASIPNVLDFSDKAYEKRLKKIFEDPEHFASLPPSHRPNLKHLYQAQILWDETMAESTANYLKKHPQMQMIVLAGNGHLEHFVGIPHRVTRRIDVNTSVILQDSPSQKGIGDFVLHPSPLFVKSSPKLGVYLAHDALKVIDIVEGSMAAKMGVAKGDEILALGDINTSTLYDLKEALYVYGHQHGWYLHIRRDGDTKMIVR